MKKSVTLLLTLLILLAPAVIAPGTDSEDNSSIVGNVEKIKLYGENNIIEWETEGFSEQGFKVVWSKEIGPEYPTRDSDRYHYFTEPERERDELEAFDGPGIYYVRVCEYLGGKCGVYSNEIMLTLGEQTSIAVYCEDNGYTCMEKEECEGELKDNYYCQGLQEYCCAEESEAGHYKDDDKEDKIECNNGCLLNEICYPLGHRIDGQFCSNNLTLIPQIQGDEFCENNFECKSNICVSGECVSPGLIQKILSWLKSFFG